MIRITSLLFITTHLLTPHTCHSVDSGSKNAYLRRREQALSDIEWGLDDSLDYEEKKISSSFNIALMNMGDDKSYDHLFERAARRWQQIVIGDLPDEKKGTYSKFDWFDGEFGNAGPVNVDVDDVLIGYSIETIDGLSGILGFAGPVYTRETENSMSAISGIMKFDKEDFDDMPSDDAEIVILHEMGHVLGIGTFWHRKCGTNCDRGDVSYTCNRAKSEYQALGFKDELHLEKSVCGHWSESNFGGEKDELMTPYFDKNKYQPISSITCAALYDLGYEINFNAADLAWEDDNNYNAMRSEPVAVPSKSFVIDDKKILRPKLLSL